jgi:hypothetical protein
LPKIIKLSVSPWPLTQEQFNCYTPNNDGIVGEYQFMVNDDTRHCDYWIVRGGLPHYYEMAHCPPQNVIFLLDEVYHERLLCEEFVRQFAAFIGTKNSTNHPGFIHSHEILPWFFPRIRYNTLRYKNTFENKKMDICIVGSDATWLEGHKKRFAFANQLIGHFKDKLNVYGRGFQPFDNKFEILKEYRYSIAIENNIYADYFTEKINECFLSDCMPIYYGCPNIEDFYDPSSLVKIDFNDLKGSIASIEKALEEKYFDNRKALLLSQKEKYFIDYHFPDKLISLLEENFNHSQDHKKITLYSEKLFLSTVEGISKIKLGSKIIAARIASRLLARKYMTK